MAISQTSKELLELQSWLNQQSRTFDLSLSIREFDGPYLAAAKYTNNLYPELENIGGVWEVATNSYTSKTTSPAVVLPAHPGQIAPLCCKDQFVAILGGVRASKSETGALICIKTMLEKPGCNIFYVVPTFSKKDIVLEKILRNIPNWIVPNRGNVFKLTRSTISLKLYNGSTLEVISGEGGDGKRMQGREADLIILEEFRECFTSDERANKRGYKLLSDAYGRLMNTNGRLIIISSPPARPHILADIYNKGQISIQEDAGDLSSFKFKTFRLSARQSPWSKIDPKNPLLMLDMAKKILDPVKYMQDIEGECIFASGQDYYNFDTKLHILNQKELPYKDVTHIIHQTDIYLGRIVPDRIPDDNRRFDYVVGLDLGVAATTAVIAKIYIPNDTDITLFSNVVIIVLDTLQSTNTSLNDFCANHLVPYFRSRNIPPKRVLIFADPSSKSREISTGFSTIRLLNSTYGYRYCLDNRKKRREIGTESARAMLQQKRLFIMEHCDKLIEAMLNYNTSGKSQHAISKDPYGHYCDALRYLVSRIAPLERMLSKEEYNKLLKESYDPNGNVE